MPAALTLSEPKEGVARRVERTIRQVIRDSDGDIVWVADPRASWSPRLVREVVADIEGGGVRYVVSTRDGTTGVHVVAGPNGHHVRTDPDSIRGNNLDHLPEALPAYLGNHPDDFSDNWTDNLNGVTHSGEHWFFTQEKRLLKFYVTTNLETGRQNAVAHRGIPGELRVHGYDHFGDPDYLDLDGQGYIFVPVEGGNFGRDEQPRLAVFRDDDELAYVGAAPLVSQTESRGTARAGWCAISPVDRTLYSSHNLIDRDAPVFRYAVAFDRLRDDVVSIEAVDDFVLRRPSGEVVEIPRYLQGGCFSPRGHLYLANGKIDDNEQEGGIRVFDMRGVLIVRSSTYRRPFLYQYDSRFLGAAEEPEGLTHWDLDTLPPDRQAPGAAGQLHAILLDNDPLSTDEFYLKHYRIPF